MSFNPNSTINGFVRITITGLRESIADINGILRDWPQTHLSMTRDATTFFFKDAQKNAHVITGKTKASIHIDSITQERGIISAGFGMPFEEKRGGTRLDAGTVHKTFSGIAAKDTAAEMPTIIKKRFDELLAKHKTR